MYSERSETFKMEIFPKIVNSFQPLAIFAKHIKLFVSQGYKYASDKTKQNSGVFSFISQKTRNAISADLLLNSILSSHSYLAVRH